VTKTAACDDRAAKRPETATGELKCKPVFLADVAIGSACTWYDVVTLLESALGHAVTVRSVLNRSSEGPDGFYVSQCEGR